MAPNSETTDNIVYFNMPDGTKVSNDPRWRREKDQEVREALLAATPNTGTVGVHPEDERAQRRATRPANLNSGQPGVGENAVPDDPEEAFDPEISGRTVQREARQEAEEKGASPSNPSIREVDTRDSNEEVKKVREARLKRQKAAQEAAQDLADSDEDPGDPEKPYTDWSAKQLKAEVLRRNAERDEDGQINLKGVRKRSELAKILEADDRVGQDPNNPSLHTGEDDEEDDDSEE